MFVEQSVWVDVSKTVCSLDNRVVFRKRRMWAEGENSPCLGQTNRQKGFASLRNTDVYVRILDTRDIFA